MAEWWQYRDRCDTCGKFVRQMAPGVSWCQTRTHMDLNDPVYRCSPCTDLYGVGESNCHQPEKYSGRNPTTARQGGPDASEKETGDVG